MSNLLEKVSLKSIGSPFGKTLDRKVFILQEVVEDTAVCKWEGVW